MADCFFCGDFVGDVTGDGGTKGRTVGNKDICEQCLGELKHWLNGTLPRSPGMRERKMPEDDTEEVSNSSEDNKDTEVVDEPDENDESGDPFSSSAKI